jgi:AcrR family transcriptional regulator
MPRGDFDRSARKADTRARLLQAAAQVYARHGLSGATLDEVAAEAGFTKGAVYAHFGSKENLLMALMEEHTAEQVSQQIALFDRERSTWERPLAGSARWMEMLEREPERFRLFVELWSYAQRDERLRERLAEGLGPMRAMFAGFAGARAVRQRRARAQPRAADAQADRPRRRARLAARRRAVRADPRRRVKPRGAPAARRARAHGGP